MQANERIRKPVLFSFIHSPVFRVVATWVWWLPGAVFTVLILLAVHGVGFDIEAAREVFGTKMYVTVYIEIVSVGLLPVLLTLASREKPAVYGMDRNGLGMSLLLSLLFVAGLFAWGYLAMGQLMSNDRPALFIEFPWNVWYGLLGIFAWGPLEVFFFVWLVTNSDRMFKSERQTLSWGLLLTVLLFALAHIPTTSVINAVYTGAIFLVLGLIYTYTGNSIGPMIAWTLINGQVWYIARLLFV